MSGITLRVLDGADRGRIYQNVGPPITIGREEGNTIQLNDERISRYHIKIQEDNNRLVLTDLDSTNGTKVNGERVLQLALQPGAELDISKNKYKIQYTLPAGVDLEESSAEVENIFGKSLLEKAGLEKPKKSPRAKR